MSRRLASTGRASVKRACLVLIVVLIAVSCGSDKQFLVPAHPTGPTDPTVPAISGIASLVIQGPAAPTIGPGETLPVKAIARLVDGSTRDVTGDAQWTSTQPQIATVNAGTIMGQALGRVGIRATYN